MAPPSPPRRRPGPRGGGSSPTADSRRRPMLAEALRQEQLPLPPPVGDMAFALLHGPPPPPSSQVVATGPVRPAAPQPHRPRLWRFRSQLYLIPLVEPGMRGVVKTIHEALDEYREKEQKARRKRRKL